jgi:hypothetical protein
LDYSYVALFPSTKLWLARVNNNHALRLWMQGVQDPDCIFIPNNPKETKTPTKTKKVGRRKLPQV